jgi:CRAL/TRIO domain
MFSSAGTVFYATIMLGVDVFGNIFTPCFVPYVYKNVEQDAVQRFAKYWERRIELFGRATAFQTTISLDMLDQDSRVFLRRGIVRWIRRTNDRDIIFLDPSQLDPTAYQRLAAVQAVWYLLHTVLEHDVRVQQKGLICLGYPRHVSSANRDPALTRHCLQCIQSALPIRITAFHCSPIPTFFYWVLQCLLCLVDERVRQRLIVHGDIHDGDVAERLERGYGIEPEAVPRELGGKIVWSSGAPSTSHEEWCINAVVTTTKQQQEQQNKAAVVTAAGDSSIRLVASRAVSLSISKQQPPNDDLVKPPKRTRGFRLFRKHCK